jgi:hypothetical protein
MSHDPGFAAVLEWQNKNGPRRRIMTDIGWRGASDLTFGVRDQAWSSIESTSTPAASPSRWRYAVSFRKRLTNTPVRIAESVLKC